MDAGAQMSREQQTVNAATGRGGLLITDLRCALPAEAWTDADSNLTKPMSAPSAGKWRIIDYQTADFSGSCLWTIFPDAAPVRIPLGRTGWHAISIGMCNAPWDLFVEARLTGESVWGLIESFCPTAAQLEAQGSSEFFPNPLREQPWRMADLTGRDLELRYPLDAPAVASGLSCAVFSVRATPLRPEDVTALTAGRTRRLIHGCRALPPWYDSRFDDGDWDTVCYDHPGTDVVLWPTKVGTLAAGAGVLADEFRWQPILREIHAMVERGEDPLRAAIEHAHAHAKRFWMGLRPQAWTAPPPLHQVFRSPFFAAHPEYRCVEADGEALGQLSIAYPEVRQRLNAMLVEALERGADGVAIACHRGHPLVRYEKPVLTRFRERYGEDMRDIGETDGRLQEVWAEFVIEWLRDVRRLLDAAGPTRSGRPELAVIAGPDLAWNRRLGLDVAAWAREDLVDVVMPFPRRLPFTASLPPWPRQPELLDGAVDIAGYGAAVAGAAMQVIPCLGHYGDRFAMYGVSGVSVPPQRELLSTAHAYYAGGAAGLYVSADDAYLAGVDLHNPEVVRLWHERFAPAAHHVRSIADVCMDRNPPGIGY